MELIVGFLIFVLILAVIVGGIGSAIRSAKKRACPQCGESISRRALVCPFCHFVLKAPTQTGP